ncbi:MAG: divalent-cation tolerance protein CutA [Candidatus Margulisiibacteriota bacterium]
MNSVTLILTTVSTEAQAQTLVDTIMAYRLAGCAQIDAPITSTYWWKGQLESASEIRCWFKVPASTQATVMQAIKDHHPFDVPQIVAIQAEALPDYATWLEDAVQKS